MKHFYFLLLFFCTTRATQAQTYIGPLVGMDYSNFRSIDLDPQFQTFWITDTGFVNETPFWGFRAKQQIVGSLNLVYQFTYTEKKVNAGVFNFIPFDGIMFKHIRNNLLLNYKLANLLTLGAGGSLNVVNEVHLRLKGEKSDQIIRTFRENGLLFSAGINYKNFNLEGLYYHGLTTYTNLKEALIIAPTRSFGIALSYDIRIWRGWGKRKQ